MGRGALRTAAPEGRFQALAAFLIGFVVLMLVYMVPILGFVTWALTSVMGLGAAVVTFRTTHRRERQARLAAVEPTPVPEAVPGGVASVPLAMAGDAPVMAFAPAAASGDAAAPAPSFAAAPPVEPPPVFTAGLAAYPRALFLDRVAAFAIDTVLVAIANNMLDLHRQEGFFFVLLVAYHIAFWAWKGTTIGGIVCSLRVVRTHGVELRFVDALVRGLAGVLSVAAVGIGVLWMLQDRERQMWHDKVAGTLVVKVPRELVLP
jgi:uncharacterized RDD family membrane protein YckC